MANQPAKPNRGVGGSGAAGKGPAKKTGKGAKKVAKQPTRTSGTGAARTRSKSAAKKPVKRTPSARKPTSATGLAATPYAFSPPVAPRPEQLPLSDPNWSWEGFQAFCLELVSLIPITDRAGRNHHFGKQGDPQGGIDLFADMRSSEHWGFQCKKEKRFGKADAQKAIMATTYKAKKFVILLSIEATAAVRTLMRRRRKWYLWDVRDISQRVRQLPLDDARRLLDAHFGPPWRRAFLGLTAASTFPTADAYFRPLLDPANLFRHTWALIGRGAFVDRLHAFVDAGGPCAAVVLGRGGIGKTKLLHAFSQGFEARHPEWRLFFLAEGLAVTPESLDDLPAAPSVVVVDDAHRRSDDVAALLALLQQRTHPLKVVLVARPQGGDHLDTLLHRAGIDARRIARLGTVGDLSREDATALARQALGEEHAGLADRLAEATRDCPLVTVVGGQLLARRGVDPLLLERQDDFRQAVLAAFHDVVIGEVGRLVEPRLCRRLLAVLAAVAPIRPADELFHRTAATFLGVSPQDVAEAIDTLERHGVLLRRGYSLRLTPDVLADHVLHAACFSTRGEPTGFAPRVYEAFAAAYLPQVLGNLAELDWRVRLTTDEQTDLITEIWVRIEEAFRAAPHAGRCRVLDGLRDVAYFQPGRMIALVQYALRNPATAPDGELHTSFLPLTHADVEHHLPELLKRIAYTPEYVPACADLLWELGRDDDPTGRGGESAASVLLDLASYRVGKPITMNRDVVDAVGRWLREPDAHDHRLSPLDVLDPVFAKTGETTYSVGYRIRIQSFQVNRDAVADLRGTALGLVRACAASPRADVVLRAVASLERALRPPVPIHNLVVTNEDHAGWVPEQLAVIDVFAEVVRNSASAAVHWRVSDVLSWYARYGAADVRRAAAAAVVAIPDTFDLRLTRELVRGHFSTDLPADDGGTPGDVHQHLARQAERRHRVAADCWERFPEADTCLSDLSSRLRDLRTVGWRPSRGRSSTPSSGRDRIVPPSVASASFGIRTASSRSSSASS